MITSDSRGVIAYHDISRFGIIMLPFFGAGPDSTIR